MDIQKANDTSGYEHGIVDGTVERAQPDHAAGQSEAGSSSWWRNVVSIHLRRVVRDGSCSNSHDGCGGIVDLVRGITGDAFMAYATVFAVEVIFLLVALYLSTRLSMDESKAYAEEHDEIPPATVE